MRVLNIVLFTIYMEKKKKKYFIVHQFHWSMVGGRGQGRERDYVRVVIIKYYTSGLTAMKKS